ncbi:hypothetical protein POM88_002569 [Heracleum sosnowskyi]|uniref:Uncharacterized protein n=1 Tax=Heracleum sosnowskyi TaxID=360622 RepID=A0AAD8JGY6_9APIA|nr:hypothetical protein POM88_002563 [Heracleum sosnowskyi]KAK1402962.1 hypothetical protein POM88_002567 [Heracleum sosnowskyi]KAK1402964.1 hypothetical protein POM88_002569 [Heracleum sosnowskyi]
MADVEAAGAPKKRTFKKFSFRVIGASSGYAFVEFKTEREMNCDLSRFRFLMFRLLRGLSSSKKNMLKPGNELKPSQSQPGFAWLESMLVDLVGEFLAVHRAKFLVILEQQKGYLTFMRDWNLKLQILDLQNSLAQNGATLQPVLWEPLEGARHGEYQITTSGLDLQDKSHHFIYGLGKLVHSASENHMDDINRR